ncbi:MAG: hypothetical protein ACJ786_19770 [Catenulispora sp.]
MADVKARITAGVGAWLVGATTATCLSLFAVSFLNTDLAGTQGATLSTQDVNRALSSAASASPSDTHPAPAGSATSSPDASGPAASSTASASKEATAAPPSAPLPSSSSRPPTAASTTTSVQATASAKRRISGHGGQVEAQCQGSLAYLVSWSPAQGFHAGPVQRGPARYAAVVFVDDELQRPWSLRVSCVNGTPAAVSADDDWHDR